MAAVRIMADNIILLSDEKQFVWVYDDIPLRRFSTRRMAEIHRQLTLDKRARILDRPLTHEESKLSVGELEVLRCEIETQQHIRKLQQ